MKSLSINQMEDVSCGGSTAGCIVGASVGLVSIVIAGFGTAGVGAVAAALLIAELSPVFGCLL